jgi:hypothetical protein
VTISRIIGTDSHFAVHALPGAGHDAALNADRVMGDAAESRRWSLCTSGRAGMSSSHTYSGTLLCMCVCGAFTYRPYPHGHYNSRGYLGPE